MRKISAVVVMVLAVMLFSLAASAETLVFFDSFEDNTVGKQPAGWSVNHELGGIVVDASNGKVSDGKLAVELTNTPELYGQIEHDIPETVKGKFMVDFYQPTGFNDNINIEVFSASGRLIGVFITQSGNVRPRPAGQQTGNLVNLPIERWHTLVLTWDENVFNVYYLEGGKPVPVLENAEFDPAGVPGGPANRILLNVTKREDVKKAYYDNIRVYDLSK